VTTTGGGVSLGKQPKKNSDAPIMNILVIVLMQPF